MKFKTFVDNVNKLLKDRPELAELEVVTSKDDEGNFFNTVHYEPYPGFFDAGDFTRENTDNEEKPEVLNAVCVN